MPTIESIDHDFGLKFVFLIVDYLVAKSDVRGYDGYKNDMHGRTDCSAHHNMFRVTKTLTNGIAFGFAKG